MFDVIMPPLLRGADGSNAGGRGLAPKPAAADNVKYLKGDGTWSALSNASAATNAQAAAGASTSTFVTPANAGIAAANVAAPRAPRQALVFAGSAGAQIKNPPTHGTSDFSVAAWVMPTAFAAIQAILSGGVNSFALRIKTDGTLDTTKTSVADNTASTAALTAGKWAHVAYVRSGTTGTYYINGVASGTTSDSRDYSAATYTIGGTGAGAAFLTGIIAAPLQFNRALSAAQLLAIYEQGAPATIDVGASANPASNTSLITGDNSTFDSDTGYWARASGATISGGTLILPNTSYAIKGSLLEVGKRYRAVVVASNVLGSPAYGCVSNSATTILVNGTNTFEFVADGGNFGFSATAPGNSAVIESVLLYAIGLLCAPEVNAPGNGFVWNDQSGNGAHIVLPSSGVAWALPNNRASRIRGTTNTNGNQQLHGAGTLLPATCQILRVRARSRTGTPSITVGTASGGAQIVASVALSTTWKDLTIALTGGIVTSAADIWIGSNSTDVVEIDITLEPLSF